MNAIIWVESASLVTLEVRREGAESFFIILPGRFARLLLSLEEARVGDVGIRPPPFRGFRQPGQIAAILDPAAPPEPGTISSYISRLKEFLANAGAIEGLVLPPLLESARFRGCRLAPWVEVQHGSPCSQSPGAFTVTPAARACRVPGSIEALEGRVLLASFSAMDYFPHSPSDTWSYAMRQDGEDLADRRTIVSGGANGTGFTVKDYAHKGWTRGTITRTYSMSPTSGLQLWAQTTSGGTATFRSPLTILAPRSSVGDVVRWSNVPIRLGEGGPLAASGVDTGSSKVAAVEAVELTDGRYLPDALKVVLAHTESASGSEQGVDFTLNVKITEVAWFVKGVGMVKASASVAATIKADGYPTEHLAVTSSSLLTYTNRLPWFAYVDSGKLTVSGTAGDDQITVRSSPVGLIGASRNGDTCLFREARVRSIAVWSNDGDDRITSISSKPALLDGGAGNDELFAATPSDTLQGGRGDDILVTINSTATDEEGFNFNLNRLKPEDFTMAMLKPIVKAAERWSKVIADEQTVQITIAAVAHQDVPAKAAPQSTAIPSVGGSLEIDPDLFIKGKLQERWGLGPNTTANVFAHEFGHILGINASNWQALALLDGQAPPLYIGAHAVAEYRALLGNPSAPGIPLDYGLTPLPAHWSSADVKVKGEIMAIGGTRIGRLTVAALEDLGYDVDMTAAER